MTYSTHRRLTIINLRWRIYWANKVDSSLVSTSFFSMHELVPRICLTSSSHLPFKPTTIGENFILILVFS